MRAISRISFFLILLGITPIRGQTSLTLGSHWGGLAFPEFNRGWQAGVTFLAFTEFDSDGRKFGVPDSGGSLPVVRDFYPETVGFNFFTLAYSNHVNSEATELANLMYRYGLSLGINSDLVIEHYQNKIIHKAYRNLGPVPRDGVRCGEADFGAHCLDYAFNGEVLYRFTNLELQDRLRFSNSNFFSGVGVSLASTSWEGYTQFGLADFPTLLSTRWFGIKVGAMVRIGGILQNPIPGAKVFEKTAKGFFMVQGGGETTISDRIYPIVVGNFFSYHSGYFIDGNGRQMDALFWTLSIELDQLYFEAFNDMLAGTDFGPTFGIKFYWDFEGRSAPFRFLERFIKQLNKS